MYDFLIVACGFVIGLSAGATAVSLPVIYAIGTTSCTSKAAKMDMPHSYGLLQGCMVQDRRGRWWPIGRYSHITVSADEE